MSPEARARRRRARRGCRSGSRGRRRVGHARGSAAAQGPILCGRARRYFVPGVTSAHAAAVRHTFTLPARGRRRRSSRSAQQATGDPVVQFDYACALYAPLCGGAGRGVRPRAKASGRDTFAAPRRARSCRPQSVRQGCPIFQPAAPSSRHSCRRQSRRDRPASRQRGAAVRARSASAIRRRRGADRGGGRAVRQEQPAGVASRGSVRWSSDSRRASRCATTFGLLLASTGQRAGGTRISQRETPRATFAARPGSERVPPASCQRTSRPNAKMAGRPWRPSGAQCDSLGRGNDRNEARQAVGVEEEPQPEEEGAVDAAAARPRTSSSCSRRSTSCTPTI